MTIRNILFIIADQWRGDTLGLLENTIVQTPNLDALAADGALFRNHFCQASPCGPSRASFLTGLYMCNHRQVSNGTPLDARLPNLATAVKALGYEPALVGYTDSAPDPFGASADRKPEPNDWIAPGFVPIATFLASDGLAGWRAWLSDRGYSLPKQPYATFLPAAGYDPTHPRRPSRFKAEHSDTAYLVDAALGYLKEKGDDPWFVHFNCLRPHPPMVAPAPYNEMYALADIPLPHGVHTVDAIRQQHPWTAWVLDHQRVMEQFQQDKTMDQITDEDNRYLRAAYYGNCSEVDAQLGRLIGHLKRSGQYDHTLIIFGSDHGDQLGDKGLYGRRGYFDQHFHVPLIIRDPRSGADATRGTTIERFSESIDLLPTILDALGGEFPGRGDGHSLIPLLNGVCPEHWRECVHWELDFRDPVRRRAESHFQLHSDQCHLAVIRDTRFKYVQFAAGLPGVLFDLTKDPQETINCVDDPDYRDTAADYAQKLLRWRLRHDARGLTDYYLPFGSNQRAQYYSPGTIPV